MCVLGMVTIGNARHRDDPDPGQAFLSQYGSIKKVMVGSAGLTWQRGRETYFARWDEVSDAAVTIHPPVWRRRPDSGSRLLRLKVNGVVVTLDVSEYGPFPDGRALEAATRAYIAVRDAGVARPPLAMHLFMRFGLAALVAPLLLVSLLVETAAPAYAGAGILLLLITAMWLDGLSRH